jgi:DNA-directed RNA polymerase
MLTINKLKDLGITSFTSIHDSYGTHACDTDTLHRALREAFIEQYSQDVLQDFKEQVEAQYEGLELPEVPPKGLLNLESVKESLYFFA